MSHLPLSPCTQLMRRWRRRHVRKNNRRSAYSIQVTGIVLTKNLWSIPVLSQRQWQWQMANASVNVHEALKIAETIQVVITWWPLRSPEKIKTMDSIKCGPAIGDKMLYDMTSLSSRLITVGQHRQVNHPLTMNYALFLHQSLMTMEIWGLWQNPLSSLNWNLIPAAPNIMIVGGQQFILSYCLVMCWVSPTIWRTYTVSMHNNTPN